MMERIEAAIARRLGSGLMGAISMVAAGAAATRVAATLKDLVVARQFGTSDELDAFLLAFVLPVCIAGVFRSGFYAAFVPRFIEAEVRRGPMAASDLLARALWPFLAMLLALAAGLALLASPLASLLAHGFPPEKRALTRDLMVALAPFVVLDGVSGIYTATLNAKGRFVAAALITAIPPLVTLGAVATLVSRFGVMTLVGGAVGGAALEATAALMLVRGRGVRVAPVLAPAGAEATKLLKPFAILAGGTAVMSLNTVIDQAMAAGAGPGSVAALGFGAKVPASLLGLAALALGTTTFTRYSEMVAARRWTDLGSSLRRHATRIALASAGIAALLAVGSLPLTRLLFERGSFTPQDTVKVAEIQALYALQIPGFLVGMIAARYLTALGRDRSILAVSIVNFALNVLGNWVLLRWIGLPGIALSTAVVYTVAPVILLVVCRRALRARRAADADAIPQTP